MPHMLAHSTTDHTTELLAIMQEESAEIIQAVSKILRFGLNSVWLGESNKEHLEEEIGDLMCIVSLLIEKDILDDEVIKKAKYKKLEKLKQWSSVLNNRK